MIVVETVDGQVEFEACKGYSTDEHNNLCIKGDRQLLALFANQHWLWVRLGDESSD